MSKICIKKDCPNRISIGTRSDFDRINFICPSCEIIYYQSDSRQTKVKRNLRTGLYISLGLILILAVFIFRGFSKNDPDQVVKEFFTSINNGDYERAFHYTNHGSWESLTEFKNVCKTWSAIRMRKVSGKSYYSQYLADTILNVTYSGIFDSTFIRKNINYDYHLSKLGSNWKIIRLFESRTPGLDVMSKPELPTNAEESVKQFLNYLSDGKCKKAYQLVENPDWGSLKSFCSNNGRGCIESIRIDKVEELPGKSETKSKVLCDYYTSDPCNSSKNRIGYFGLEYLDKCWKITSFEEQD